VLTSSPDGTDWSPVTRIPLDPIGSGVDHFIPGLAVDRATAGSGAHLAVTYYFYPNANCTAATCQLDVGVATSADGGATWTAGTRVAGPMSLQWLPNTSQGYMGGWVLDREIQVRPVGGQDRQDGRKIDHALAAGAGLAVHALRAEE
jgi:hypothetical protein